jgi:hypothetical protein
MLSRTFAIVLAFSITEAAITEGAVAQSNTEIAACVAKLSADGILIFNSARPELGPATDLTTLVRATAVQLVGTGKVSQAAAPAAALAAAACLELLRK